MDQVQKKVAPSTFQSFVAGAISGVAVDFILFPLDTVKTRLQSSQGFIQSGGFSGVYKGVGAVGLGSAPGAASFFVTYEQLKKQLPRYIDFFDASPSLNHMVSASGAEVVSCLIRVPTEVVKSRTQAGTYGGHLNSWKTAGLVLRHEGIKGFYRGFGITITREIPFTSIQFPLYEYFKTSLSRYYLPNRRAPAAYEAAACGAVAGAIASACTTPLDVVKTRVMLEAKGAAVPGSASSLTPAPSALTIPSRLVRIYTEEGMRALFKGGLPRTFAIATGGAVFLGMYEGVSGWVKRVLPDY